MGKVILVGAGPGDPGLITLSGLDAIKHADVILYDALAHPSLLSFAKPDAQLVSVGKRKGEHYKTQSEINSLMKSYAQHHALVVRLKGGDPLLFGRGAEEIDFLKKEKINYGVVPGVSSALAVPAYAGISLTHRDLSKSVAFVTGSPKQGEKDTDIVLPIADTLVILMGVSQIDNLVPRLLSETPFRAETPVAVISKGTLSAQAVLRTTLGELVNTYHATPLEMPAMLVVGEVSSEAANVSWLDQLPLWSKRVVLLRSSKMGEEWAAHWRGLGAEVVQFPLITPQKNIENAQKLTQDFLAPFEEIILTSPTGVTLFVEALFENGLDMRSLHHKKITVIGQKTAETLLTFGVRADRVGQNAVSEGVLEILAKEDLKNKNFLIPTAEGARSVIPEGLDALGAKVVILPIYASILPETATIPVKNEDIIIFTSGSTVRHFYNHPAYTGQKIYACCIGPITAKEVLEYQKDRLYTASAPTLEAITHCLKEIP